MIKNIIHPITGQTFTISDENLYSVITAIVLFVIFTAIPSKDWLSQSLIQQEPSKYGSKIQVLAESEISVYLFSLL